MNASKKFDLLETKKFCIADEILILLNSLCMINFMRNVCNSQSFKCNE